MPHATSKLFTKILLINLFVIFATSNLLVSIVNAEDWKPLEPENDGTKHYYDHQSIKMSSDDIIKVWFMIDKTHRTTIADKYTPTKQLLLIEFNCKNDMMRMLDAVSTSVDGQTRRNVLDREFTDWQGLQPGSRMEYNSKLLCNSISKPAVESVLIEWDQEPHEMIKSEIYKDFKKIKHFSANIVVVIGEGKNIFQEDDVSQYIDKLFAANLPNVKKGKGTYNPFSDESNSGRIWLRIWITKGDCPAYQVFMKTYATAPTSAVWQREVIGYGNKADLRSTIIGVIDKMMREMAMEYQRFK